MHDVDESLNLGDINLVDENNLDEFNFICGGSPCFMRNTKVITKDGYKNIEDITTNDYVLTHKNRFMKVNNIGGEKNKEIYCLNAQGFLNIYATDYHPFYVKKEIDSVPEKMKMIDIKPGYYIGQNINTNSIDDTYLTDELLWILGRYVADGHIRIDKRKNRKNSYHYQMILSIGENKVDYIKEKIKTYHYSCYKHSKSVYRLCISNMELVKYINENGFGNGALNKKIPSFILDLPKNKLKCFLDGYMSGDGSYVKKLYLYKATTISKELALSLTQAVLKVYGVGCRIYHNERPNKYIIEGRTVNQNNTYQIVYSLNKDKKHNWFIEDNVLWNKVKKVYKTDIIDDVFNIEVDVDHTYTANNCITYNCQDFSVSGKQKGSVWTCNDCGHEYNPLTVHHTERNKCPHCGSENISKTRSSLLVEWLRIIKANKPNFGIYENVKNIVGKNFKETFDLFIEELHDYGYNTYYDVLCASDYGVPQNRHRLYLVIIKKELDNGLFKFPEPFDNGEVMADRLDDVVDDKYYVDTKKSQILIEQLESEGKLVGYDE